MPSNSTRTIAPRARKGVAGRTTRSEPLRRGPALPPEATSEGLAFSAIKVEKISGAEVFCRLTHLDAPGQVESMYNDLKDSFLAAMRNWKGFEYPLLPWWTSGSFGKAIHEIISDFERFFADRKGMKIAVSEDGGRYHFNLYHIEDSEPEWNVVEVRKLLTAVRKKGSKALLHLTRCFLKAFVNHCSIGTWYNGALDYAEEWVEQQIEEAQGDDYSDEPNDPVARARADEHYFRNLRDLESQRIGAAAQAGHLINQMPDLTAQQILKRLQRIRVEHPVKEAIRAGCALLQEPYGLDFYSHFSGALEKENDLYEYGSEDSLEFWNQWILLWDYDNAITDVWEEYINQGANDFGIQPPVVMQDARPDRTDWCREEFDNAIGWPQRLQKVFDLLCRSYETPLNES